MPSPRPAPNPNRRERQVEVLANAILTVEMQDGRALYQEEALHKANRLLEVIVAQGYRVHHLLPEPEDAPALDEPTHQLHHPNPVRGCRACVGRVGV